MRVGLGFSTKAWLFSVAAGMILTPTIALVAQTIRGPEKSESQSEADASRPTSPVTINPKETLKNAVQRELDLLNEQNSVEASGVVLASTDVAADTSADSGDSKKAPSRFQVPKFAKKIQQTISAGTKKQASSNSVAAESQPTNEPNNVQLTQQITTSPAAQPQSEIQKHLQELYKNDSREMPNMNLSNAPNTKVRANQRIVERETPVQPQRWHSRPVRFFKSLNPFRRNVTSQPRKLPNSKSQSIVKKPSRTIRPIARKSPTPPADPKKISTANTQNAAPVPIQNSAQIQAERSEIHGLVPPPPDDPAPAAEVLADKKENELKILTNGPVETAPAPEETPAQEVEEKVAGPLDDFENPFTDVSEDEADSDESPFSGLKLKKMEVTETESAEESADEVEGEASDSIEVADEAAEENLPVKEAIAADESDDSTEDEFANPFGKIETGDKENSDEEPELDAFKSIDVADTKSSDEKPQHRVPEINPRRAEKSADQELVTSDDAADDEIELKIAPADDVPLINPGESTVTKSNNPHAEKMKRIAERADLKGLKGFCVVALRDDRDLVDGSVFYTSTFLSKEYQFSTAKAKERFDEEPELYAPAAGGDDIVLLTNGEETAEGSLDHAVWYKDRLYLFSSAETLEEFTLSPSDFHTEE